MMTFKCKMCGGDLSFEAGASVAECPYCGTMQTLPKLDDDKRANLYDRANHFRRQNEYDKAMAIYEQILAEDRADAEAYWSLVLCRYGIEYVEDPATRKRVQTVNRVQYASILADEDYKAALSHADTMQRGVYEAEANAIAEIQKGILDISSKEEPFDVFICYKETDENGRRTPDSVLATDLYHQLTKEGFKVFFSRITLEDKIGTAYEPYIFAALNSAKVMVAMGTKPQYFNAVWVKNEWKRFLSLIKSGAEKTLVPAYRDMDPYDLPDEFAHLQALDMGKLGFMQDLIRGIKKLTSKDEPKVQSVVQQVVSTGSANIENLMKRVRLFMEDGDWNSANEYLNKVLDENAEYAPAYMGKVQAAMKLRKEAELASCLTVYEESADWEKALRFATPEQKRIYEGYIKGAKEVREERRKSDIYDRAWQAMNKAKTPKAYDQARIQFESIPGYKDADLLIQACRDEAERYKYWRAYLVSESLSKTSASEQIAKKWEELAETFSCIKWEDAGERAEQCKERAQAVREEVYVAAKQAFNDATTQKECEHARTQFKSISGYRDADQQAQVCQDKAKQIRYQAADQRMEELSKNPASEQTAEQWEQLATTFFGIGWGNASERGEQCKTRARAVREEIYVEAKQTLDGAKELKDCERAKKRFEELGDYHDAKEQVKACDQKKAKIQAEIDARNEAERRQAFAKSEAEAAKRRIRAIIMCLLLLAIAAGAFIYVKVIRPNGIYNSAMTAMNAGNYDEATAQFENLGDYKDAPTQALESKYRKNIAMLTSGNEMEALLGFRALKGYSDSADRAKTLEQMITDRISGGDMHTVCLKLDGKTVAVGDNSFGQCDVEGWSDIVAVSCGRSFTVGLKSDGTVVAVGKNDNDQCNVSDWKDIVAVSCGDEHTVGLKSDGTVIASGDNWLGQCNVSSWIDIVAVSCGYDHTAGLKSDGTVVAEGDNSFGQCNVGDWKNIVAISSGHIHTVGLKSDGTMVAVGRNNSGECNVSSWRDIVAVSCGYHHTVGLKTDGTVVATGNNSSGQCNVGSWRDIVAVTCGYNHTVGLKSDGTVVAVGENHDNQCNISAWNLLN